MLKPAGHFTHRDRACQRLDPVIVGVIKPVSDTEQGSAGADDLFILWPKRSKHVILNSRDRFAVEAGDKGDNATFAVRERESAILMYHGKTPGMVALLPECPPDIMEEPGAFKAEPLLTGIMVETGKLVKEHQGKPGYLVCMSLPFGK
jgi:hypothetical protein